MKGSFGMDMTHGPLAGKIMRFALPLMAANLVQLLFNAADIVVVGRFAGSASLAAVSSTTAVIHLLVNLLIGSRLETGRFTVEQQGQQLLGAAVEADVPRHDHREPAALRVLFYGLHNFFRGDGFLPGLSGSGHALEHSSGADEAVRLRNGLGGSQSPVTSVSRADAHHRHLGRLPEVQLPAQHRRRLGKA